MCTSQRRLLSRSGLAGMILVLVGCSSEAPPSPATSTTGIAPVVETTSAVTTAEADDVTPPSLPQGDSDPVAQMPKDAPPVSPLGTQAWSSFRNSPQQLGIATTTLPEELKSLWEYPTAEGVKSTPAIGGGCVYVGTVDGDLLCLSLRTGELVWKYRSIESDDPKAFAPSFNAPVSITEELVLAGDQDGILHAVDRASGQRRWAFTSGGEIVGGASVVDEHVIFGSHADLLFCLNVADGTKVWEFETQGPVNGSQAIAGGHTFVVGCSEPILRVVDLDSGEQVSEIPMEGLLIATPALREDVLYFGTNEGGVYAIDWQAQKAVWKYADPDRSLEIHSSPAVTEDRVIIGGRDKRLHCVDRLTGERVWTFATRAGIDSSPVVVGDRVFFGSGDKNIYGVSLETGQEVWKHAAGQSITGSPAVGEGCLVIGTDQTKGRVLCFGSDE